MSERRRVIAGLPAMLFLCVPTLLAAQDASAGKEVYDKWCAGCHGETGAGDGEAARWMLPPPRDFTGAVYQIRSTANGELPTDADLRRMVDDGMPGTAMPGWREKLSERERDDVVAYLKTFSRFFEGASPQALDFGRAPGGGQEAAVAEGRAAYETLECFKCHGDRGRGDGESAPTLTDDWDAPIRAADLTESWYFTGGSTVDEIFRRLLTGLDGTPMPSFADVIDAEIITREQLWRVAQYVRSLSPERSPLERVREVVRAVLMEGDLPSGPEDSAWAGVERFYIPLVGQIIVEPRWFTPTVDGLWAQAAHNGTDLALKLSWSDPSRSPDPSWQEWLDRVREFLVHPDGPLPAEQGPDQLFVQLPRQLSDGMDRPYFLRGDTRRPVELWHWSSEPDRLEVGLGTGIGQFAQAGSPSHVTHTARFADGSWELQFNRPLVPADTASALTLTSGRAIPIGFFAADGSNGEGTVRGSVSAWYAIYLDVPTPATAFVAPVIAVLLTALAGGVVVWRAQKRGT